MAFVYACELSTLEEDEGLGVELEGVPVGIFRVGDSAYAIHDICSHEHAHLSEGFREGFFVDCPLHMARFDVRSGELIEGPAPCGVRAFSTQVRDGKVYVDMAEAAARSEGRGC